MLSRSVSIHVLIILGSAFLSACGSSTLTPAPTPTPPLSSTLTPLPPGTSAPPLPSTPSEFLFAAPQHPAGLITIAEVRVESGVQVSAGGQSDLPEGTCLHTQLFADDQPLDWWPAERCLPVQAGGWSVQVRLGEAGAPRALDEQAMYRLRAWSDQDPRVMAEFPFDLAGPPGPAVTPTPAPSPVSLAVEGLAGGRLTAMEVDRDIAYLALGARLVVLNVSDPADPRPLGESEPLPYPAAGLALHGPRLYWLSEAGRLLVFDVADPAAPELLRELPVPPGGRDIAVRGEFAYSVESRPEGGALRIYSLSDPLEPVQVGVLETEQQLLDLRLDGKRVYVRAWAYHELVIDLSDPASPVLLAGFPGFRGMAFHSPYAYAAGQDNLEVFDLADPRAPVLAGRFNTPVLATRLAVEGERIYLLDEEAGLYVLRLEP